MAESTMKLDMRKIERDSALLIAKLASPKALLTRGEVANLFGFTCTDSTPFVNMLRSIEFPQPIYVGTNSPRWLVGEINRYIERTRDNQRA